MDYTLEISTSPTIPDQWLGRAKRQLRIESDETYDDALVLDLLSDATDYVGDRSDTTLLPTTFKLTLPGFPKNALTPIYLPRPPLVSVSSIAYVDVDGASQSIDIGADVDVSSGGVSLIHLKPGKVWPTTICRENSVSITYIAGTSSTQNVAIRAIMLLVGHWYLRREDAVEKRLESIPYGVDALIYQLQPGDEFRKPIENDGYSRYAQSRENY